MKCKAGITCESEGFMNRYIEDCEIGCESVTPQILGAPFFKGNFVALIIPTGFGNSLYSCLLPALRASSGRIKKFVEKGGKLISFGAMTIEKSAYDWLPFECEYIHEYFSAPISVNKESQFSGIMDDFDSSKTECDGYFKGFGSDIEIIAKTSDDRPVMIAKKCGEGYYVLTSIHELPSKSFIKKFCTGEAEILF
ncbi:MAG: hypothetical protein JXQ82_07985 [Methanomicrobiaceae archaeon]|nr:hypothetical protein [Methanomicrobiaceae archaeon]